MKRARGRGCARWVVLLLFALAIMPAKRASAHETVHGDAVLNAVQFDQRLDTQIPLQLPFRNEEGQPVQLGQFFDSTTGDMEAKPVILALTYFTCDTLCPLVREGLVTGLKPLAFRAGQEFEVVVVSINPQEGMQEAAAAKHETLAAYGETESAGWHFLTGEHAAIDTLADAIGFHYAYDDERDEYAHPSGIVILTPGGRIARYFYGIEYDPQDVRLGLVEASANQIGTAVDQLLLLCYHYDPISGKYTPMVMTLVRIAGVVTVAGIGLLLVVLWRKDGQREAIAG